MSNKLALSSALSVLMMAAFALCGPQASARMSATANSFGAPGTVEMTLLPKLPSLPGLR
jgi:hypothetical protein